MVDSFEQVAQVSPLGWTILTAAALLIGFSKTAIGGLALVAVALFALVLPTKDSTGAVLLLLITGDLVATWVYRKHADWRLIARLILPVLLGIGLGAVFLAMVNDLVLRRTIGVILLVLLVAGFWREKLRANHPAVGAAYGGLAGFTTMVANAGGPPMNLYLLAAGYDKWRFLGTSAWFFFAVNLTKLPVSIGLGIVRLELAMLAAMLVPAVLLGTWVGRLAIKRIDQQLFERLVTGFVALAAVYLLLG